MGNITITIKLVGQHHNQHPADAERMAARFVDELRKAGHSLVHAGVTYGGEMDVLSGLHSFPPGKEFP